MPATLKLAMLALAGSLGYSQPTTGAQRLEITLERQDGSVWSAVAAGLVFQSHDHLRFRLRTNFDGFLYVMNQGTSGQYATLFPREETGLDNRVKAGTEYLIPSTQASFRIDGPAGYDIVYWMISPLAMGSVGRPAPPSATPEKAPANMTPRCDETLLRARGLCIDSSAGPRNITSPQSLPSNLSKIPGASSRDIVIINKERQSVISSAVPLRGPVLYEFRVAHK